MNRTELTLLVAATFLFAVLIGWVLRWLFVRINQTGLDSSAGSNDLAARLHEAEEERDRAIADRDAAIKGIQNRLAQTEAELAAAMEGLGDARRDSDALRRELMDMRE